MAFGEASLESQTRHLDGREERWIGAHRRFEQLQAPGLIAELIEQPAGCEEK